MSSKQRYLIYGLQNNKIINIENVESGLACNCQFPSCGEKLVAKKGKKVMHHFAHKSGATCEYGYETSLHLAAKEILSKTKEITIPAVYVHFPDSLKKDELICESKKITLDHIEVEHRLENIIPDLIVHSRNKVLLIEIYATHAIDETKLKKIKALNISTIEINLKKIDRSIDEKNFSELLINGVEEKKWIYNSLSNNVLQEFYKKAERKKVLNGRVFMCPIRDHLKTSWAKISPFANYHHECLRCTYCVSTRDYPYILCTGKSRIATVQDLHTPYQQRLYNSNFTIDKNVIDDFADGFCPNCGGKLVRRTGKNGTFLGCSNYPYCKYTHNLN